MLRPLSESPTNLDLDVAIYGGGPAGITLAMRLAEQNIRAGLFEAGGLNPVPLDENHPYRGESTGRAYDPLTTRLRFFGGTSNHWGGWVRPLEDYDFAPRPGRDLSGWPLSAASLKTHFDRAVVTCEVETGGIGAAAFEQEFGYDAFLHHRHDDLVCKNFLFGPPTRFGKRYRDDIEGSPYIEGFLNATLTELRGKRVIDEAVVLDTQLNPHQVRASHHVLAMGAIENARTLLHNGVANSSDFVGRCFSDHLGNTIGEAMIDARNRYYRYKVAAGNGSFLVMPHLGFTPERMRELDLNNFGIVMHSSRRKAADADDAVRQLLIPRAKGVDRVRCLVRMENTPNPDSRILLGTATDKYGIPRPVVDWHVNRHDFRSIERLARALGPIIGQAGGRVKLRIDHLKDKEPSGGYQAHHLGTTRMSEDPSQGVVNANLQCHDVANLHIAGSSVFPTYGFANPTLTLIALTHRLADRLIDLTGEHRK